MTQDAVVTKLIDKRTAEVEVERGTACGGNCGSCEACVFQNKIRTTARNRISALPGQKVVIETKTSDILGAAALLYLVPFVLLFIGYAIGAALSFGQGGCILVGGAALPGRNVSGRTTVSVGTVIVIGLRLRRVHQSDEVEHFIKDAVLIARHDDYTP